MAIVTVKGGGAFTRQNITDINNNFSSLGSTNAGGTLTNGYLLIGNGSNVATAVLLSGDVTTTNAGVTAIKTSVALTTPAIGAATGASLVLTGDCRAATFHAGATAGVTAGPFTTVASIATIGGLVTTLDRLLEMGKTLDQIVMDSLGLKEMTIARLLWEIDDLKDRIKALEQLVPASEPPKE